MTTKITRREHSFINRLKKKKIDKQIETKKKRVIYGPDIVILG